MSITVDKSKQQTPSLGGNLYVLVMIDEVTRFVWTRLIKHKGAATEQLLLVLRLLKSEFGQQYPLARLHTDGGREFVNATLSDALAELGICTTHLHD
jgi:transposase InsO family protein